MAFGSLMMKVRRHRIRLVTMSALKLSDLWVASAFSRTAQELPKTHAAAFRPARLGKNGKLAVLDDRHGACAF